MSEGLKLTAFPGFVNTFSVATCEHILFALFLIAILFVGSVRTVGVVVTHPGIRYALAGKFALELVRSTCGGSVVGMLAIHFIRFIVTVVFAVAVPYLVDAASVAALEFSNFAFGGCTRCLITSVGAIVVVIAHIILGNAFAIGKTCVHV